MLNDLATGAVIGHLYGDRLLQHATPPEPPTDGNLLHMHIGEGGIALLVSILAYNLVVDDHRPPAGRLLGRRFHIDRENVNHVAIAAKAVLSARRATPGGGVEVADLLLVV